MCLQTDMTGLPDGFLLMALNENPSLRTNLSLVHSTDGGASWTRLAVVEDAQDGAQFSYPTVSLIPSSVCPLHLATQMVVTAELEIQGAMRIALPQIGSKGVIILSAGTRLLAQTFISNCRVK